MEKFIGNNLFNITYPSQLETIIIKLDTIFSSIITEYPSTKQVTVLVTEFNNNDILSEANNVTNTVTLNSNNDSLSQILVNDELQSVNYGVILHELLHILG